MGYSMAAKWWGGEITAPVSMGLTTVGTFLNCQLPEVMVGDYTYRYYGGHCWHGGSPWIRLMIIAALWVFAYR